jgi:TPR repeat protein
MLIATFALCLPLLASDNIDSIKAKADQGDAKAQDNLGDCYRKGDGVKKSPVEAVKWYRKSADQGDANAQFNLGNCYDFGSGVEKDLVEAVKWYRKSADQGDAESQYNLGVCYYKGDGVEKDPVEAVKWYRKSAEQGDVLAQFNLGVCYGKGEGVEMDKVEAYALINLAATTVKDARKARDAMDNVISSTQRTEAQQRTKELQAQIAKSKSE